MAAAEYFSNAPMGPSLQTNPYQRPQYAQTVSSFSQPQQQRPPPYEAIPQGHRPTVHFADQAQRPHRQSFSSQAPIPVLAEQQPQQQFRQDSKPQPNHNVKQQTYYSPQQPPVRPQPHYSPQHSSARLQPNYSPQYSAARPQPQPQPYAGGYSNPGYQQKTQDIPYRPSTHDTPQDPRYLSPYAQPNQSQYALNGYTSDPEPHRRRRRRHSNDNRDKRRQDREPRDERAHKQRSRSTNADGFLGAAGGGLIGDLIFPGLGTVGGAVAGWIGGKDYGKHRKTREGKLDRDQEKWEHKFGHGNDAKSSRHDERDHRSHERHKYDY